MSALRPPMSGPQPPRPRRPAWPVAAAAVLLLALPMPGRAQAVFARADLDASRGVWRDTAYVDAVIRLDVEGGPSAVIPALVYNTTLLLPVRQFFEMVEIRVVAFALRDSAVAMLEPGHLPLRFKPLARVLTRGAQPVPYDTMDVVWWDGDLFVATELLDRLLGISTSVAWSDLSAMVGQSAGLPVVQRLRRERRHQLLGSPRPVPGVLDIPLRERVVDGAVASWAVTASKRGPSDQMSLELGLGAGLFGGGLELRPEFWSSPGYTGAEVRISWSRVWQQSRWVRQVRVGDVLTSGRHARLMTGLVVTNAPFIRSSEFDVEHLTGRLPSGWEVELYDGGRLLAYADADALGAFRVPLQLRYGQNPFELVMYGPAGELVRQKRTVRVPFSRVPSGQLEYAVAGGRCRYDPCDGLLSADARYGLSNRVTLQGGWDAVLRGPDAGGTLWQPYAIISGAPLAALAVTAEAVVNGHLRAAANFEPTMDLRAEAGYTRFDRAGASFGGTVAETGRAEMSLFWRPGWMQGLLFFQSNGVWSTGPGLSRSLERLSATTRIGRVRYTFGLMHDNLARDGAAESRRFTVDGGADAVLLGPWPWLRSATVQGLVAVEPARGLTAARATLGRRIARALRLDAGLGWFREAGYTIEVGFATALPGPRVSTRSRLSSAGAAEALLYANGSVAWDPRSRMVLLGDGADLGRAGISGTLFRDDNGNRVRDRGEPGLSGIPVHVGGWPAETDAQGRFAAWGLFPSEPLQIDVDSLSFEDPQLVLPAPVIRVRPAPNAFGAVDVPVVVGAEVSGYVVFRDEGLAGVPVVLRELETGAEIRIMTYSDGGFYRAAVPPGEYEVTLPEEVLERLGAFAPPLSIFVPPGAGEKRYQDLHLRLEPRP